MVKKFKILLKSKESKVLSGNFLSLSILKIIGFIFPLITLPYLARVIGIDKFGELAFASSVVVFFETFVDYGFNYTATRDVAKNKDDIAFVSKVFSTIMVARMGLVIISLLILLLLINILPLFNENKTILLFTFSYVIGYALFPEWIFQALEKMKYITIMNVVSKTIFTVLVFIVILEKEDYIYQPILTSLGFLVSGFFSILILWKKFGVKFIKPTYHDLKTAIKSSTNMFISLFLPNLYTNFSVVYLSKIHGDSATGVFSSGFKFISIFDQLMQVLSRTFYPFLARRMDKHKAYIKIGLVFSLLASISLFLLSSFLIDFFYTDEFAKAIVVVKIMSICPFFLFLINTYGPNYLVLVGKEKTLRNIVIFCSIFGLILTLIFTSRYGFIGIAQTLTITWGVRGFITWYFAYKHKKTHTHG